MGRSPAVRRPPRTRELLEIRIRHLENELALARAEREDARRQYFDIVTRFERTVDERTRQMAKWQEILHSKHQELQRVLDFSPALVFYLDRQHRFTRVNREFARAVGKTRATLLGQSVADLFPDAAAAWLPRDREVFRTAQPLLDQPADLQSGGRALHLLLSRVPLLDGNGKVTGLIGFGVDVTRWRESESEKQRLQRELRLSEKMGTIGLVAGGVAHDLNNMLSAIVCYPDLILDKLPADSPERRAILAMKRSGQKAAAIVHDLLTLARRGLPIDEVVSLNQVIDQYFTSPEFERLQAFHPQVGFQCDLDAGLPAVHGSPVHLGAVVMNLVSNAAEAIPGNGRVRVATRRLETDGPLALADITVPGGAWCVLSVGDDGSGIAPEDQKRIFEPFFTKKALGSSGTGLGMAVVNSTVQDHRGHIHLQSEPGRGTTFEIYLPASREPLPPVEAAGPAAVPEGRNESILVVDDSPDQLEMAATVLGNLGFAVTTADSGERAVERIRQQPADLLLLNMIMAPGIDGLETYRRILSIRPRQRAVIVSGLAETEHVREARRLGAGTFVRKPYTVEKLVRAIRCELDRPAPSTPPPRPAIP